jgi:hypothetical protein
LKAALAKKLAGISTEKLLHELGRRLPAQLWNKHQSTIKALCRALDASEQHLGPTLEGEAISVH